MALFAELDNTTGQVLRVVVCENIEWLQNRLGGNWVETKQNSLSEQYAAKGMYRSNVVPRKFCQKWTKPTGAHDAYDVGQWVWHNGLVWENLTPANVWEPGVTGWRDPLNEWPTWIQPVGAHDAYPMGAKVTHKNLRWVNTGSSANVWEPGVFGWTRQ